MSYFVYDEEGKMIRCFRWKWEALAFLQDGWFIKKIVKRDGYSESFYVLGDALI